MAEQSFVQVELESSEFLDEGFGYVRPYPAPRVVEEEDNDDERGAVGELEESSARRSRECPLYDPRKARRMSKPVIAAEPEVFIGDDSDSDYGEGS